MFNLEYSPIRISQKDNEYLWEGNNLVIVNDLHLTACTSGMYITFQAFKVFHKWVKSMSYKASNRDGDIYFV